MALINCPECKKEISDKVTSCPHCGYPFIEDNDGIHKTDESTTSSNLVEEISETHTETNKAVRINPRKSKIISIAIVILLVAVTLFYFNSNSYGKFKNAMKDGNIREAIKIFNETEVDVEKEKIRFFLTDEVHIANEDFLNDRITFDEANNLLNNIDETNIIDAEVSNKRTNIKNIQNSRIAYVKAIKYFEEGKFRDAISEVNKVIKLDKNYDSAMEYRDKAKIGLEKEVISKAKELASKNNFIGSVDIIEDNKGFVMNKENLEVLSKGYKESASKGIIDEAKEKYESGNFDEALTILKDNVKYSSNSNIQDEMKKVNQLKKENNKNLVQDIKKRIIVNYDDVNKEYLIAPKSYSTRYVNVGRSINIEPRMTFKTSPSFIVCIGFQQSDWIFMEKAIFVVDNVRVEWTIDFFDRGSQVGNGIAEWYSVVHSEILSGYTNRAKNLTPLMNSIIGSNSATIRFQGQGYRDHTITNNEKQTIRDLWNLYNILEDDPSLFSLLK